MNDDFDTGHWADFSPYEYVTGANSWRFAR
jgi:hypothetical protein